MQSEDAFLSATRIVASPLGIVGAALSELQVRKGQAKERETAAWREGSYAKSLRHILVVGLVIAKVGRHQSLRGFAGLGGITI